MENQPITKELFFLQKEIKDTITYYKDEITRLETLVTSLQEERTNLQTQLNEALNIEPGVGYANQGPKQIPQF